MPAYEYAELDDSPRKQLAADLQDVNKRIESLTLQREWYELFINNKNRKQLKANELKSDDEEIPSLPTEYEALLKEINTLRQTQYDLHAKLRALGH